MIHLFTEEEIQEMKDTSKDCDRHFLCFDNKKCIHQDNDKKREETNKCTDSSQRR